jgi:hypothetical protein
MAGYSHFAKLSANDDSNGYSVPSELSEGWPAFLNRGERRDQ